LFNLTWLPTELLLEYDQNIVKHTRRLNEHRITHAEEPIVWKYFQYLALLFTEVYLDWYFTKPDEFRAALNDRIAKFNSSDVVTDADRRTPLNESEESWKQLNKLAFWMATGAGKTLLMHANILQYQFYLEKHGRAGEINRVILLTPNEGLSRQHLRELEIADLDAEMFDKASPSKASSTPSMFAGGQSAIPMIDIIEVSRLVLDGDEASRTIGEKSVPVASFEGNNLVLVDEGHRGTSGGEDGQWLKARSAS
jgi:hypothetical protein